MSGGSGFDKYDGGTGDDWIEVDGTDLGAGRSIAGGDGTDVLDIGNVDLTGSAGITGIEVVTMEPGSAPDVLSLSAADVVAMTDAGNTLFVWVDNNDDLVMTGGGWSKTASDVPGSDGGTYHVFQSGLATVIVETQVETTTP